MATLEELDFKLIIDDGDFNKKINDTTKKAKDLNTSLSNLLTISQSQGVNDLFSKLEDSIKASKIEMSKVNDEKVKSKTLTDKEVESLSTLAKLIEKQLSAEKEITKERKKRTAETSKTFSFDMSKQAKEAKEIQEKVNGIKQVMSYWQNLNASPLFKNDILITYQKELDVITSKMKNLQLQIAKVKEVEKMSTQSSTNGLLAHIHELTSKKVDNGLISQLRKEEEESARVAKETIASEKQAAKEKIAIERQVAKEKKELEKQIAKEEKERQKQERITAKEQERIQKEAARLALMNARMAEKARKQQVSSLYSQYSHYRNIRKELTFQNRTFQQLKSLALAYFSVNTVRNFVRELVNVSAEFEKQKIALGAIINDSIKAEGLFAKLQTLAVKSPFNFTELTTYAKQLSAYNIPVNELYQTTKMLADVSAGLGVDMSRLVLAFGQVSSAEFLRGQEIRQFTEAGLPILQELAKQFSVLYNRAVSVNEVFDLVAKRKVPFEMVKQVFIDLTSEGGKFFNMQEILADTLSGKISNLKDAYQMMLYEIGQSQSGALNGVVDTLRKLITNYEDVGRALKELIVAYGIYKAVQIVEVFIREAKALRELKAAMNAVELAQFQLDKATKRSGWGLLIAGIVGAGVALYDYIQKVNELSGTEKVLNDVSVKFANALSLEQTKAKLLLDKMSELTKGTEEYDKAKNSLLVNFSQYLSDLDKENIEAGNLVKVYDSLSQSIERSVKARMSALAQEKIATNYETSMTDIEERAKNYAKKAGLSDGQMLQYMQWIRQGADIDKLDSSIRSMFDKYFSTLEGRFNSLFSYDFYELISKQVSDANNVYEEGIQRVKDLYGELIETVEESTPKFNEDYDTQKDVISKEQQRVEKTIALYRKLDDMKKKLVDNGVENPNGTLATYFPWLSDIIKNDAKQKIEELLDYLSRLSEEGKQSAINIRFDMQNDALNTFIDDTKKAQEELQKLQEEFVKSKERYDELIESLGTTTELQGVGAIFDISKDVKSYTDNLEKIKKKREEVLQALDKTNMTDSAKLLERSKIETLTEEQADNLLTTLRDKLHEDGGKVFKEFFETLGLPEGEWSKVDPFKRLKIEKELKNVFSNEKIQQSRDSLINMLKQAGFGGNEINSLMQDFDNSISEASNNAKEKVQGIGKAILKYGVKAMKELSSAMQQYAEASGDSRMKEGAELLNGLSQIGQGFLQGGWQGAVVAAAKIAIDTIVQELSYNAQLVNQIKKAKHEVDMLDWNTRMEKDSIFGDSSIHRMSVARQVLDEITAKYAEINKELENQSIKKDWFQGFESLTSNLIFTGINIPAAINDSRKQINAFNDAVKKGYQGLERYVVKFNDRGGFANFFGFSDEYMNLKDLFASVGFDSEIAGTFRSMYDEYGNLNSEGLQKILDTYDRISNADREWMEKAIDYAEEYKEIMSQVDEVLENVYGDAVSTLADRMIDNWIQMGNAAGDYSDILSDVARNYAKLIVQNALLETIFDDDLKQQLRDSFLSGDTVSAMSLFRDAFDKLDTMLPVVNDMLQAINNEVPLMESTTSNLSDGIKSITEETASLLASYVNAIRADVSLTRIGVQGMSTDMKSILGLLPSSPTLSDYLNQIQANTYDTKLATEQVVDETHSILNEIRGVIGTETGISAIRVSM